jgi:Phosphotransferase system, mannose/fructose/N-acetylgalactosamine-specific component IID
MSDTQVLANEPKKLTKGDISRSWIRWYCFAEMSNSFERLQTVAFCASMIPILKKLYTTKEELSKGLARHLLFFNTQGDWGSIIHGVTIAMEEQKANGENVPDEAITGIKTGLMGPFAGIGDTIDWGIIKPIIFGLFLPLAMTGHWTGSVLPWIIFTAITMIISYLLWHKGYTLGRESFTTVLESGWIQQVITGAGVLGLFMMGALSASFVKLSTPIKFTVAGGNPIALQGLLDKIVPGLLPLLVVFGIYIYMVKQGPKFGRILLVLLVASILTSVLGIF